MSGKRIRTLTDEQLAQCAEFQIYWQEVGRAVNTPLNDLSDELVVTCYRSAGLTPPKKIVWCRSPPDLFRRARVAMAAGSIPVKKQIQDLMLVRASVAIDEIVSEDVRRLVAANVRVKVEESVWNRLGSLILAGARSTDMIGVGDAQFANLRTRTRIQDLAQFTIFGCHDAHQLADLEFFLTVFSLAEACKTVLPLWEAAEKLGWWIPFSDVAYLSPKPTFIRLDEHGRLDASSTIDAVIYPDSWTMRAMRGVVIARGYRGDLEHVISRKMGYSESTLQERYLEQRYGADAPFYTVKQPEPQVEPVVQLEDLLEEPVEAANQHELQLQEIMGY